ncbi:lipoprotein [Morganella morganii]
MKKITIVLLAFFVLSGCTATNPPDAPEAKGDWIKLNTTLADIQAK